MKLYQSKNTSIEIKQSLKSIINILKKSNTWRKLAVNFVSSKDTDEECVMHLKSDNIEIII